ncbi:hypothetical protein LNP04_10435 [Chryseobacterium sp. C-71]|uniref:hypothetical protein n=1 Tax=Chryseobacterium sp. C-71 TaxID=2893882 RepID=UPI001E2F915D|nr:hypothetical protein [Chryseobacterium sp. C-71]UFH30398.1 hypothetical protein LNP04_10435 [Chryseobacterium sp. C-71]
MKKIKLLSFLLFGFLSCQKQGQKDMVASNTKEIINVDKIKFETAGFSDKYDLLPKLDLKEIDEKEFNQLKNFKNDLIKKPLIEDKGNYYLEVGSKTIKLKKKEGTIWYNYLGFYTSLNMYAFSCNSVSESLGFSDFELINKSNGKIYKIVSPGDDKIETPISSPNIKYLAYFYNQIYSDNNSFLGILKIDSYKNFQEFSSFTSENFRIHQIAWSIDNLLLVKTSSDNERNFKYYKSDLTFKKNEKANLISNKWFGNYTAWFSYGEIGGQNVGWELEIKINKENIIASGNGYQIGFTDELNALEDGNKLILKHKKNIDGYTLGENMDTEFVLINDNGKYFIQSKWIDSDILTKPDQKGYKISKK